MAYSPWGDIQTGLNSGGFTAARAFPDADTFDIGDVVSLIVGGPAMVVISVCECSTVEVAWSDSDGDVCVDVFPEEALVYAYDNY